MSPVSSLMGWARKPSLCNQLPWPTQPGHSSVGRRNEYWRRLTATATEEVNGDFCPRGSKPRDRDYWYDAGC